MRRREESGEAGNHETVKWTKPVSGSGFCTAAAQASSSLAEIITKGWQTCSMSINNNDCSNKIKLFWILWEPLKRSQFRSNAIPFANSCHNFSILAQLEAIQGIIQTSWQQWIVNTIVHKKQMFGDDFFASFWVIIFSLQFYLKKVLLQTVFLHTIKVRFWLKVTPRFLTDKLEAKEIRCQIQMPSWETMCSSNTYLSIRQTWSLT